MITLANPNVNENKKKETFDSTNIDNAEEILKNYYNTLYAFDNIRSICFCPNCNSKNLRMHEKKPRKIKVSVEYICSETRVTKIMVLTLSIKITRLKCLGCNKTHVVLLDNIIPHKNYTANFVANIEEKMDDNLTQEEIVDRFIPHYENPKQADNKDSKQKTKETDMDSSIKRYIMILKVAKDLIIKRGYKEVSVIHVYFNFDLYPNINQTVPYKHCLFDYAYLKNYSDLQNSQKL